MGVAAVFTAAMLLLSRRTPLAAAMTGPMALGGFLATVAAGALVANHWGDAAGLRHAAPALLVVLAVSVLAGCAASLCGRRRCAGKPPRRAPWPWWRQSSA